MKDQIQVESLLCNFHTDSLFSVTLNQYAVNLQRTLLFGVPVSNKSPCIVTCNSQLMIC